MFCFFTKILLVAIFGAKNCSEELRVSSSSHHCASYFIPLTSEKHPPFLTSNQCPLFIYFTMVRHCHAQFLSIELSIIMDVIGP